MMDKYEQKGEPQKDINDSMIESISCSTLESSPECLAIIFVSFDVQTCHRIGCSINLRSPSVQDLQKHLVLAF